jgi:ATP-dependent RNA helicase MRH4
VTTDALTSLLPRRRPTRANSDLSSDESSEEDSDASEERGNDDDELVYAGRTRSRARPLGGSSSKAAGKQTTAKESEEQPSVAAKKRRAARRTYGSRSLNSDKENEGEEDDLEDSIEVGGSGENTFAPLADDAFDATEDSVMMAERLGEELKNAARKFKEVDKWELSFEEAADQPSSPKDAR